MDLTSENSTSVDIEALNQQIYVDSAFIERLNAETSKVIVGQQHMNFSFESNWYILYYFSVGHSKRHDFDVNQQVVMRKQNQ